MSQKLQETLDLLKTAQANPNADLAKAFNQSGSATSGITAYDLEGPAKTLYPVLTPLRNAIPRVPGRGGIQANWRAITGINTTGMSAGLGQGNRGGVITTTTADYNAAYRGIGLDDYATFEAETAAEGFDDVKARAVENLLRSLMIQEEKIILGGNSSTALGVTPTPTTSTATSGGTIPAVTNNVFCVALSFEGYLNASVAGGIVAGLVTRTNADGSVDTYGGGAARKSAAASQATTGGASTISASVTAVAGAYGYAWYFGTAGNELLAAITTINSVLLTAPAAGTQNASAVSASTDYSTNSLIFDGLLTFCSSNTNGAYRYSMPTGTAGTGTPLTSGGDGGIVEIDNALKSFWDNYRLSPDEILVSSQEQGNIQKKVLTAASNSAQRFTFNVDQGMIAGGTSVKSYNNKFAMGGVVEIPIRLHPNMPAGTILFMTRQLPYPLSNVSNVLQVRTRRDYYQIEWPQRSRKYEYGIYADEVLQNYFPPAFGIITNIANG
jgi:hypothetical protein